MARPAAKPSADGFILDRPDLFLECVDLDRVCLGVTEGLERLLVKQNRKYGFSGDRFLQTDFSAMLLGDVLSQREPEAHSILLAGTHERLEERFADGVGHPPARNQQY